MDLVNAIGLGVMGLSLIPMVMDLFPAQQPYAITVRIAAGMTMPGDSAASTGGNTAGIGLFDVNGGRIGFKGGAHAGKIGDGEYADITVNPMDKDNNRPPEYLSIAAGGTDSLCVAYIAVTPPTKEYWAFYGDVPKLCGAYWYHSNLEVQTSGQAYYPSCFWLSQSTSQPFPQGYGVHLTDFALSQAQANEYNSSSDTMCKSDPRYKAYPLLTEMNCLPVFNPVLQYTANSTDADLQVLNTPGSYSCEPHADGKTVPTPAQIRAIQRWGPGWRAAVGDIYGYRRSEPVPARREKSVRARQNDLQNQACADDHVVISGYDRHTATEICQSHTSAGPDFVSTVENLYCDMCKHELWPVCSASITQACFDMGNNTMRAGTGPGRRDEASGREIPERNYSKVTTW